MRLRASLLAMSALLLATSADASVAAKPWIGVSGNHLVNGAGLKVRLLGVNRSGAEYACVEEGRTIAPPTDAASIAAMKSWHINAVRLPLNESCWLGLDGLSPYVSGAAYRAAIAEYVQALERHGLYVILDLQWAAPGTHLATGLVPMPDADHAPEFWYGVASVFREDRGVIFDLFNEPEAGVSWECWNLGCEIYAAGLGWYRAAGMQQLVDAVRAAGATQPLMLGGTYWAQELGGWLEYLPVDPLDELIASNHSYDFGPCHASCKSTLLRIAKRHPVVTGELGEIDCGHGYIDPYMRWADRHEISYLGWAWNAEPGSPCASGPSLIEDYAGTPSSYGIGLREHLRKLALPRLVFNDPIG